MGNPPSLRSQSKRGLCRLGERINPALGRMIYSTPRPKPLSQIKLQGSAVQRRSNVCRGGKADIKQFDWNVR
jgi:hypothetical protein